MSIQYEGDDILFVESDMAMDPSCCCGQGDSSCCCLEQYVSPATVFHVTFSGAISGTGTISIDEAGNSAPYCLRWAGTIALSSTCGGQFFSLDVALRCLQGQTGERSLQVTLFSAGSSCTLDLKGGTWETGSSCLPLYLVLKMWTKATVSGGCPCGDDQLITMTITL